MANFKQDILEAVGDEVIEAIKILGVQVSWSGDDSKFVPGDAYAGKLVSGIEIPNVLRALDYEYSTGYGSQDCHTILVWTTVPDHSYSTGNVYSIHEYDGSTSIISVPRHPQ